MVSLYPGLGRVSSGDLGNLNIFVLALPRGDDDPLGLAEDPTVVAQVIDDLASPLVGLLVVLEGSIGLDDTMTELTEADDELAAVAVVAHSIIIGQGAQDLNRNLKKFGQRRVVGAIALLSLSIHYYRPGASINLEKPPENIALMGLLRTGSAPRCIHQLL